MYIPGEKVSRGVGGGKGYVGDGHRGQVWSKESWRYTHSTTV